MTSTTEASNRLLYATRDDLASVDSTRNAEELKGPVVDGFNDTSISPKPPSISTSVAKINRLPPEILVAIFIYLSKPEPSRTASHFVRGLIFVTRVCWSWRRAAITAPELWTEVAATNFGMMNLGMIKLFLQRSGASPLNVYLHAGSETGNDELLEAVIPHAHRIRQLLIFDHPVLRRTDIDPITFTEPAPSLEKLVIRHNMGNRPAVLFDDQAPRLRKLVLFSGGFWLQNHLWNLTSLSVALSYDTWSHSDLLPFFDMLRRCPVLEEMYVSWCGWGLELVPPQTPTVPLHHLRKLLLRSFPVDIIGYLLHTFDLRTNGIAVHLEGVRFENRTASDVQTMFPNADPTQPSLVSSTKLEFIFHKIPLGAVIHAVGPGFSTRIDLWLSHFTSLDDMNYTFYDVFPSVRELWIRGSNMDIKLEGLEHFTALEKLVLIGRKSNIARNFQQALSPGPSGILSCPLLSTIDCHGDSSEMREIFLLLRVRSSAGRRVEKVRVPSDFIPLPADIASCVRDVGSLDISTKLHAYGMELPEYCFSEGAHEWWESWEYGLAFNTPSPEYL